MNDSKRQRATQQRSVVTRERILEAAVRCLAEEGYAATTTVRIQQRAAVSRGRLLHHFPSREELLVAAVEHLATQRVAVVRSQTHELAEDELRIEQGIDLLWSMFDSPFFWAAMELWLAARNDPRLREALDSEERRLASVIWDMLAAVFGPYADGPRFGPVMNILMSSMRGEALTLAFSVDQGRMETKIEAWKSMARQLLIATDSPPP